MHMTFTLVNVTKGITLQLDKEGPPIRQKPVQTDGLSKILEGQQILHLPSVSVTGITRNISPLQELDLICTYLSN